MKTLAIIRNFKSMLLSKESEERELKRIFFKSFFVWTLLIIVSLSWNIWHNFHDTKNTAENIARSNFDKDTAIRFWAAGHGGVYVPVTAKTPANPNLSHIPNRDITKPDGTKLTLMNPAYMVRQLMDDSEGLYGIKGRITSLKYFHKGNKPDEWEEKALRSFEKGVKEAYEYIETDNKEYLRLMRPLHIKKSCLKCHAIQGYKVGDVRGGVGVVLPMKELNESLYKDLYISVFVHTVLWLFGIVVGLVIASRAVVNLRYKNRAKKTLEQNEKKFHALYDNAPDMYVSVSPEDTSIVMCNQTLLNKTGYERNEVIGSPIFMMYHEDCMDDVHKAFEEFVEKGKVTNRELILKAKDGSKIYVNLKVNSIKDSDGKILYSMSSWRDITEQIELQEALRVNQNYLQNLFESTPNIMITTDGQEIERANRAMLEFTGYDTIEEFKKDHDCICDLFIDEEGMLSAKMGDMTWLDYALENQNRLHKAKMMKGDKIYSFLVWAKPLSVNGTTKSVVTFTDVTELDDAYRKLNEKDEIMLAQSRHAAMGEMISMIAHQWRQPISTIAMGANNILADIELEDIDETRLKDGANNIVRQTQELSKTIDDFRGFFRPNKHIEELFIEDIFKDVYAVIGKSLENNGIETSRHINSNKKIQTYSRELMQVFINIVKNAKEAMVDHDIKDGKIDIFVDELDDKMVVKICDNGGGIPDDILEHIFDPYFTTKDEKNGTGLGLYMSKTIVEKHLNGILDVKNIDNGVCLIVELPCSVENTGKRDG